MGCRDVSVVSVGWGGVRGGSDTGVVEMFLLSVWGGVRGGSDTGVIEMFLLSVWGGVV